MATLSSLLDQYNYLIADSSLGEALFTINTDQPAAALRRTRKKIGNARVANTVSAGARLVLTNSFDLSRSRLAILGLEACTARYNQQAAEFTYNSVKDELETVAVVGLIGPTAYTFEHEAMSADFSEQATALAKGGVSAFWLESFSDMAQLTAAIEGCQRGASHLPIIVTVGFRPEWSPCTQKIEKSLNQLNVFAIGADTSNGDNDIVTRMRQIRHDNPHATLAVKLDLDTIVKRRTVKTPSLALVKRFTEQAVDAGVQIIGVGSSSSLTNIRTIAEVLRVHQ